MLACAPLTFAANPQHRKTRNKQVEANKRGDHESEVLESPVLRSSWAIFGMTSTIRQYSERSAKIRRLRVNESCQADDVQSPNGGFGRSYGRRTTSDSKK